MARPTDYTPELLERARQYISDIDGLPQVAGMARFLGVSRDTLYEWAKIHDEFSDIFENVKAAQEEMLIEKGLSGDFNSTITKLMLSKHGYRESQDVTSDGKPLILPSALITKNDSASSTGGDSTGQA